MNKYWLYPRRCAYRFCDKLILRGKNDTRRYCCSAHKQAEYRLKETERRNTREEWEKENGKSLFDV